jgi:hypothetical protein
VNLDCAPQASLIQATLATLAGCVSFLSGLVLAMEFLDQLPILLGKIAILIGFLLAAKGLGPLVFHANFSSVAADCLSAVVHVPPQAAAVSNGLRTRTPVASKSR